MNFRFFKRLALVPGLLYLNISKSGISISIGKRGFTVNFGKSGVRFTAGFPGSGLSIIQKKKYISENADGRSALKIDHFIGDSNGKKKKKKKK